MFAVYLSDFRHFCVFAEAVTKPGSYVIVSSQPMKMDAVMNNKVKIREKLPMTVLQSIRRTTVRGTGKPSYKVTFEAEVPDKLKRQE